MNICGKKRLGCWLDCKMKADKQTKLDRCTHRCSVNVRDLILCNRNTYTTFHFQSMHLCRFPQLRVHNMHLSHK